MFYSVNSYSSMNGRKGMSGLMSGMDTDEMVKGMTMGTQNKIMLQLQKKQTAVWQQEAYRGVIKGIGDFQSKWLSYSSGSKNIMSSSFFNTGSIVNKSDYVTASGSTASAKNVRIKDIKELASVANSTSKNPLSSQEILGGLIHNSWYESDISGQGFTIEVDGKSYNLNLSPGFEFDKDDVLLTGSALDKSRENAIKTAFNEAISKSADLKDKIKVDFNALGQFQILGLEDKDGKKPVIELGENSLATQLTPLYTSLNIGAMKSGADGLAAQTATEIDTLVKADRIYLTDSIEGKSFNFSFNGVSKKVTFLPSEKSEYDTPDEMAKYMNKKVNELFSTGGSDKISITYGSDKKLKITTADKSDLVTITSDDKGVMGKNGAFSLSSGAMNRVAWNTPIKDLGGTIGASLGTPNAAGNYTLTINDVEIKINEKDSLTAMLSKINSSKAGVTVTYSTTSDTMSITANDSGNVGKINIKENDFSKALFGDSTQGDFTNNVVGTNAKLTVSFDGGKTYSDIERSSNSFSLDGLSVTINGKAPLDSSGKEVEENIEFSVKEEIDPFVEKFKEFLTDYNTLVKSMSDLLTDPKDRSFTPLTDEQKKEMTDEEVKAWDAKAKKGILYNDSHLSNILTDMRQSVFSGVDGADTFITALGVSTGDYKENGQIHLDAAGEIKLRKALSDDPTAITKLFTNIFGEGDANSADLGKSGISTKLNSVFNKYISSSSAGNGILVDAAGKSTDTYGQDSLSKSIRRIDLTLEGLRRTLKAQEDKYLKQFASMEKYLQQMNAQSSWLAESGAPQ